MLLGRKRNLKCRNYLFVIDNNSLFHFRLQDIAKEMGSLALEGLKKVGEAHWVFLGLSVVASALGRCVTVTTNVLECIELLQAIVDLAKDLKRFRETMPDERERLRRAVQVTVEGAIMCSDYILKGRLPRFRAHYHLFYVIRTHSLVSHNVLVESVCYCS
jgi:hypothetical protein